MKLLEQYDELVKLKRSLNSRLQNLTRTEIKAILLDFYKDPLLKRFVYKDNEIYFLNSFCSIWLEEQKQSFLYGLTYDIFDSIASLNDIEEKYIAIRFGILRFENRLPIDYLEEVLDYFSFHHISGIALCYIARDKMVCSNTAYAEKNLLKIAQQMLKRSDYISACILLQEMKKHFSHHVQILRLLSQCWAECLQYESALLCLNEIRRPSSQDIALKKELETKLTNEKDQ